MSSKKSKHNKARVKLRRLSPVSLVGALLPSSAVFFEEAEPESWQSKGKKPKPRLK